MSRSAGLAFAALPFVLVLGLAMAAAASGATSSSPPTVPVESCGAGPVQAGKIVDGVTLDSTQLGNAQIIYSVSATLSLPQRAAVIAEATAMQESSLVNLTGGTSDSLGLLQQRPSQGWGTSAEIMQPVYASTKFYSALVRLPGWQTLPLTVDAQDVQHSGHPGAYAKWQTLAEDLVATFSGQADDCLTDNSTSGSVPATGTTRLPSWYALPAGAPPAIVTAMSFAVAQLGKPYIWGGTGPQGYDCSGLVMKAYAAAGIALPRTTYQQVYAGTPVYSLSDLQPGELLFTPGSDGTATNPGHVGMYLGDGLVIQAPHTGTDIMITPLKGYWQQSTVAIRRIA